MKHLLINGNKNNMSLVPSAGEDRTSDRQARKQGEKYGKNELVPRTREDRSVVKQAGKQEKSAGSQAGKGQNCRLTGGKTCCSWRQTSSTQYLCAKKIKAREK